MAAPTNVAEFVEVLRRSGVLPADRLDPYLAPLQASWQTPTDAAQAMRAAGMLSDFQLRQLLAGRAKGFWIKRCLVLEELGAGGMGRVYLCEQTPMERLVAVKVLTPGMQPGARERFLREAKAVAALDHANIVRAFDVDEEERFSFLVMEFVDGPTLHHLVARGGKQEVGRACHYIAQAALGLHHAHQAGWVHRDVKPGNLLVDRAGTVKILDLGLARLALRDEEELTKKYDDQTLIGTADYIAPEQTLVDQPVDARADLYSLGGTLYFLLAGRAPYMDGNVLQKLMAHQLSEPPPLSELRPDLPRPLVELVRRMMSKSPAERPATAEAVAAELARFAGPGPYPLADAERPDRCPRVRKLAQGVLPAPPKLPAAQTPAAPVKAPKSGSKGSGGKKSAAPKSAPRKPRAEEPAAAKPARGVFAAVVGMTGLAALVLLVVCGGGAVWVALSWPGTPTKDKGLPKGDAKGDLVAKADKAKKGGDKKNIDQPPQDRDWITPQEAAKKVNERCTVQYVVKSAGLSKNHKKLFLNSEADFKAPSNFVVVVEDIDQALGEDPAQLPTRYQGATIRADGSVTLFNERPQMVVPRLSVVRLVEKK